MSPVLSTRQEEFAIDDGNRSWWYTDEAQIVKWSILSAIVVLFVVWFAGGYWHAKARIRKGLPLMMYHRFLVPPQYRRKEAPYPRNDFTFYRVQDGYQMGPMGEAAPAYDPNAPLPPSYQPEGQSKISPNQSYDVPPPGNPPASGPAQEAELPPRQPKQSLVGKAAKLIPKFGRK